MGSFSTNGDLTTTDALMDHCMLWLLRPLSLPSSMVLHRQAKLLSDCFVFPRAHIHKYMNANMYRCVDLNVCLIYGIYKLYI